MKNSDVALKQIRKKAGRKAADLVKLAAQDEIDEVIRHFRSKKNGGWPLDYFFIKSGIVHSVMGPLDLYVMSLLNEAGYEITYKNDTMLLEKPSKRKAKK